MGKYLWASDGIVSFFCWRMADCGRADLGRNGGSTAGYVGGNRDSIRRTKKEKGRFQAVYKEVLPFFCMDTADRVPCDDDELLYSVSCLYLFGTLFL